MESRKRKDERISFVKMTGKKKDRFLDKVTYFQCNRSGVFRRRGKGIKRLKSQGNFFYTSFKQIVYSGNSQNKRLLLDPCQLIFRFIVSALVCTLLVLKSPLRRQAFSRKHLFLKWLGCTVRL